VISSLQECSYPARLAKLKPPMLVFWRNSSDAILTYKSHNRNYSIYEGGCPLLNASLFTLKFDFLTTLFFLNNINFSVKSEALRMGQPPSYTE
jgi:hypothetical protein